MFSVPVFRKRGGGGATDLAGAVFKDIAIPPGTLSFTLSFANVLASAASALRLQIGPGAVPAATGYLGVGNKVAAASTFSAAWGVGIDIGPNASDTVGGIVDFNLLDAATNTWVVSGYLGCGNIAATYKLAGRKALAGAIGVVRVTNTGGVAFTSGLADIVVNNVVLLPAQNMAGANVRTFTIPPSPKLICVMLDQVLPGSLQDVFSLIGVTSATPATQSGSATKLTGAAFETSVMSGFMHNPDFAAGAYPELTGTLMLTLTDPGDDLWVGDAITSNQATPLVTVLGSSKDLGGVLGRVALQIQSGTFTSGLVAVNYTL